MDLSRKTIGTLIIAVVGAASLALYVLLPRHGNEVPQPRRMQKLTLSAGLSRAMAEELGEQGFSCATVTEMFFVREVDGRNHMKAVCDGPSPTSHLEVRIIARGSGTFTAEPWADQPSQEQLIR